MWVENRLPTGHIDRYQRVTGPTNLVGCHFSLKCATHCRDDLVTAAVLFLNSPSHGEGAFAGHTRSVTEFLRASEAILWDLKSPRASPHILNTSIGIGLAVCFVALRLPLRVPPRVVFCKGRILDRPGGKFNIHPTESEQMSQSQSSSTMMVVQK